jgi:D-aminopeptidase
VKIYLSSDMEGTAGVVDWTQCIGPGAEYEYYRRLLQDEVNAAIAGAAAAGATSFLVNDSHSSMQNLRPDALLGGARYLSGRHKPMYMMQGLDASFDAVFLSATTGRWPVTRPRCPTPPTRGPSRGSGSMASRWGSPASTRSSRSATAYRSCSSPATTPPLRRPGGSTRVSGVERLDTTSVQLVDDDPVRLYQSFVTLVLLTRGLED